MHKLYLLASVAPLFVALGQPALADNGDLETITVTAQKRAENIQEVPLSIMAVTGANLEKAGVENATELGKVVPSLQINNTLFGAGVVFRIRGFGTAANTATDSEIATYVDGAFIPRPGSIVGSFLDVKSVEVLNGPQGTLFGRNATMGAISITTNSASTDGREFDVKMEGGSYGKIIGTAIANVPVTDTFALRVALQSSTFDGYYKSALNGQTYGGNHSTLGRLSAKWDITPDLTWNVHLDGAGMSGDGDYPQEIYSNTASPAQLAALTSFVTRFGGPAPLYSSNPSYTFSQYSPNPYTRDRQIGVVSDLSWALSSDLSLRLIDTYRDWNNKQLAGDTFALPLNLLSVYEATQSRSQSHELQLISGKGAFLGGKLGFTSGLYYFHEEFGLNTGFNLGAQFCQVIYTSIGRTFLIPGCQAGQQVNAGQTSFGQSTDSYAGYFQMNYQLLPNLEIDAGARETRDAKSGHFAAVQGNPLGIGSIVAPEGPESLSFSDTKPSFHVSVSWHVTDDIMPFFTYSTGYKSGGFNSGAANPALTPAVRSFASETADDYELGVKSIFFDRKMLLNAALFDTELHNFQDRSFNGVAFVVRNSGEVRSRGLDLDGKFRVLPDVSLNYGVTYLDSIYTKDLNAPGLEGCTGLPGCPTTQNLSGEPLGFSPRWHGDVGVQWNSSPFMGGYTATVSATENFSTGFLTANTDNPQSRVAGFATTDFTLNFYSPDGAWELDVFGKNVLDRHYYVTTVAQVLGSIIGVNNTATGATIFRGFLADPATFGARLSTHF